MRPIVLIIALCLAQPAQAQTPNTPAEEADPVTEFMLETWSMSPDVVTALLERLDEPVIGFDTSLDSGATTLVWNGCRLLFSSNGDSCTNASRGIASTASDYLLDGPFLENLSPRERTEFIEMAVDTIGIGRAAASLSPILPVIARPFDASMALGYQRWRMNWCNFQFIPEHPVNGAAEAMSQAECLEEPFAAYLQSYYCEGGECDLARISWAYGFLSRRYLMGGDEAVARWQALLSEAATYAGVPASN